MVHNPIYSGPEPEYESIHPQFSMETLRLVTQPHTVSESTPGSVNQASTPSMEKAVCYIDQPLNSSKCPSKLASCYSA